MIDLTATIDNSRAIRSLQQLEQSAGTTTSSVVTDADRMDIAMQKFGRTVSSTTTETRRGLKLLKGIGLIELSRQIATTRGEFQQLEVAFTTLLQSKSKADALMGEAVELAAKTPFDLQGVATGARQLIAYGFAAEDVTDTLTRLGNVAAGLGLPLERLTYLYGTTMTQGRLYARDMIQFTTSGIPLLQELAKMYGKTTEEVNAMVTAGQIGFSDVEAVFKSMTDEGGKFYNLMQEQSKTITGRISNLKDAIQVMFNELGKSQEGVINSAISGVTYLVENYQKILDILVPLIAAYGAYKTAIIAVAAVQKVQTTIAATKALLEQTKMLTRATLIFNKAVNANIYAVAASALFGLVTAIVTFSKRAKTTAEIVSDLNSATKSYAENAGDINTLADEYDILTSKVTKTAEENKRLEEVIKQLASSAPTAITQFDEYGKVLDINIGKIREYSDLQKEALRIDVSAQIKEAQDRVAEIDAQLSKERQIVENKTYTRQKTLNIGGQLVVTSELEEVKASEQQIREAAKRTNSLYAERAQLIDSITKGENVLKDLTVPEDSEGDSGKSSSLYGVDYENARKEWEKAKKELQAIAADRNAFTTKQYEDAKKAEEEARKRFEDLGGNTSSKQRAKEKDTTQKSIEKANEAELEAARKFYDEETELKRKQITDKVKLIQFDLEQTLAAIEKEKQAYIDLQMTTGEYSNREDVDVSVFDKRATIAVAGAAIGIDEENKARLEAEKQAMNEYLAEYGSYLEKRQALTELYNEKTAKATTEGEKLTLTAEWESALADIDAQANKSTSAIGQLFSDMSKHTVDEMRAIADVGEDLLEFVNSGEWDVWKGIKFGITKEEFDTLGRSPEKLQSIREGIDNIRHAADDAEPALFRMGAAIRGILSGDFKGAALKEAIKTIQEGISDISQAGNFLSETFSNLGETFNNEALSGIGEGLGSVMNVVDSTLQGAEALSGFGPVGQGIGAAIGLVSSLATEIANVHDKKKEKNIQVLQGQVDALGKSYDILGKEIDKAYSTDAADLIQDQNALLEQQKLLIDQQIKEEQSKKNPDPQVIENWRLQQEEINEQIQDNKEKAKDAIFGEDLQSAIENFANAYADAWASGEDRVKSMKNVVKDMIRQTIIESIKAAENLGEFTDKVRDMIYSFLSDGIIDEWEQAQIDKFIEEKTKELDRKYGGLDTYLKEDDAESSRRSTAQGIAQASQESIDILGGGIVAIKGTLYGISDDIHQLLWVDTEILNKVGHMHLHTSEIRDLMIQSTAHLAAIRDNTGYCENLEQIRSDISSLRSAVDTISTRGININR